MTQMRMTQSDGVPKNRSKDHTFIPCELENAS